MFAIVDIETTGGKPFLGNITEIAVIVFDGEKEISRFETLLCPEEFIPKGITALTGITNEMVRNAPKFDEIAANLLEILSDNIFVAHNVNFDYSFLENSFRALGYSFEMNRLCTVRYAKKIFPGKSSYSLGSICREVDIEITHRHRAMGDCQATVTLLKTLLDADTKSLWKNLSKKRGDVNLPPNLPKEIIQNLPYATGIYYFLDSRKKVIYVGKAKNIKDRVRSHFTGIEGRQKQRLREKIADVHYQLAGNEFVASLMEVKEIKRLFPEFNVAQKYPDKKYGLFSYTDRSGLNRLSYAKISVTNSNPLIEFTSIQEVRNFLLKESRNLNLCQRQLGVSLDGAYCQLCKESNQNCSKADFIEELNQQLQTFIATHTQQLESCLYLGKGRNADECAFVWVDQGRFKGFGFAPQFLEEPTEDYLREQSIGIKEDADVKRIVRYFQGIWPKNQTLYLKQRTALSLKEGTL